MRQWPTLLCTFHVEGLQPVKSFASFKGGQRERCGAERTAAKHNDRGAVTLLK
jgi:hypothetical protein